MTYKTINDSLISNFPELASLYKEQFDSWNSKDIPQHCFLGDILNSYVTGLLRENNDKQQIEKIFKFYEEMANSDDEEIKNLLQVTLLEYLWDEELIFKNALEYMQTKTREINNKIGSYLRAPV